MKYIIVELGDRTRFGICFPKHIEHYKMAEHYDKVVSAGFCDVINLSECKYEWGGFRNMGFACYGESVTLKLKADPEKDEFILNKMLLM